MRASKLDVSKEIENRAQELLCAHPHFKGRAIWVKCRCSRRRLFLTGKVPSYYLKQLAQEAVRDVKDVEHVVNRIVVASPFWRSENPVLHIDTESVSLRPSPRITAR
jgi:osmotically-inducible protein OsmY